MPLGRDQFGPLNLYKSTYYYIYTAQSAFQVIPRQHIRDVSALDDEKLCEQSDRTDDASMCADMLPVARMVAVGESLLAQRGFRGNCAKMGFHVPPFVSVEHLHLHCLSLPLNNLWRDIK